VADELVHIASAVQHGIIGVQVQVNEICHRVVILILTVRELWTAVENGGGAA
jgi:hypothetical protein